jgi:uncharacterized membrane protein
MAKTALTTVVIGYEDTRTAVEDFNDLERAHREGRLPSYDAAVVGRTAESARVVIATTIDPNQSHTLRAAGLGVVVGIVLSPALIAAAVGAVIGGIVGRAMDGIDATEHGGMTETKRLIDESAANLIVIASDSDAKQIESIAATRPNRTVVPFSPAEIATLKLELQSDATLGT